MILLDGDFYHQAVVKKKGIGVGQIITISEAEIVAVTIGNKDYWLGRKFQVVKETGTYPFRDKRIKRFKVEKLG